MLNTEHFTRIAGGQDWDDEMRSRIDAGEDLIQLQMEFHGRGRQEAIIVDTLRGFSIRYVSGLFDRALIFKGIKSYDEAVRIGTEWVEKAPQIRSLIVRNSMLDRLGLA